MGVENMAGDDGDSGEVVYGATSHGVDELEEGRLGAQSVGETRASRARRRMAVAAAGAGAAVLLLTIAATALQGGSEGPTELMTTFGKPFQSIDRNGLGGKPQKSHSTSLATDADGNKVIEHAVTTSGVITKSEPESEEDLAKVEFFPPGLDNLSKLKPRLVDDPDPYYNVFDPDPRNKTTHMRWTRTEVRKEVQRMLKLMAIVDKKEASDHKSEQEGIDHYRSDITARIANVSAELKKHNDTLNTEVDTTKSAIDSLDNAFKGIEDRLDALDANRTNQLKGLWERVNAEEQEIDETGFELERAQHKVFGDIGSEDLKWKEEHGRLLSEIKAGDAKLEQMAANVRMDLHANVSTLVRSLEDLASELRDRDLRRKQDMKDLGIMLTQAVASVEEESKVWDGIGGGGSRLPELSEAGKRQEGDVSAEKSKAEALLAKVAAELTRGASIHNETMRSTERVQGGAVSLKEGVRRLEVKIEDMMGVFDAMRSDQAALRKQEALDDKEGQEMRGRLSGRVDKITGLRGDMQKIETGARKMVAKVTADAQILANRLSRYQERSRGNGVRLQESTQRVGAVEAQQQDAGSSMDSEYEDAKSNLEPLYAQLTMARGDVDEFDALKSRATRVLANLTDVAASLEKEQDTARGDLVAAIRALAKRIDVHLNGERRPLSNLEGEIKEVQRRVERLQGFRKDSLELEGQLKTQVSDTTEALGILDSKFSSQNDELGTHFASIRHGIAGAAQGNALKKELGDTRMQYQVIDHDLRDLGSEVSALDSRQRKNAKALEDGELKLMDYEGGVNSTLQGFRDNIEKHPPLFDDFDWAIEEMPTPPPPPSSLDTFIAPMYVNWWEHKHKQSNLQPSDSFDPLAYVARLDNGPAPLEGMIEGEYKLPFYAHWTVQYYVTSPKYSRIAPESMEYPLQSVPKRGVTSTDTIVIKINDDPLINYINKAHGKKQVYTHTFEGDKLTFKMLFHSDSEDRRTHPFVSPAEVTLVHDRMEPGEYKTGKGILKGKVINTETGRDIRKGSTIRSGISGWSPHRFRVEDEIFLGMYRGTNLVYKVPVVRGKFKFKNARAGKYTCQLIGMHFYSAVDTDCEVKEGVQVYKRFAMAIVLDPGYARAALTWGLTPSRLEASVSTPVKPACEVTFAHKQCGNSGRRYGRAGPPNEGLEMVLNVPRGGYGPETFNFGGFVPGTYVFKVKGGDVDKSHGLVVWYTPLSRSYFRVGESGILTKDEWDVFGVNGATRGVSACAPGTCK